MGLRITNESGDKPTVWLYGTIGEEFGGVTVDDVRAALNEIPKGQSFQLRIFSDGGSFDTAMAMYSLIAQRTGKSHGVVDGIAASAASLLLQATSRRSMASHSRQMIHETHGSVRGSFRAHEFREMAAQMDATNKELVAIYSRHWKGSKDELLTALSKDTYLSAQDSVEKGLADDVIDGPKIAARVNIDMFNYKDMPDDIIQVHGPITPPWIDEKLQKLESALAQ